MAENRQRRKAVLEFLGTVTAGFLARLDDAMFARLVDQVAKAQRRRLDRDIAALETQLAEKKRLRDARGGGG